MAFYPLLLMLCFIQLVFGSLCVRFSTVSVRFDDIFYGQQLLHQLNRWSSSACVRLVSTTVSDIVITQVNGSVANTKATPFKALHITTTLSNKPNATEALALLFLVPTISNARLQAHLLQVSAFRFSSEPLLMLSPTTLSYDLIKHNVSLTLIADRCGLTSEDTLLRPTSLHNWDAIAAVAAENKSYIIRRGSFELVVAGQPGAIGITLPFTAIDIAREHQTLIFLDSENRLISAPYNLSTFQHLHTFEEKPQKLFSDFHGTPFVLLDNKIYRLVTTPSVRLLPSTLHSCVIPFFYSARAPPFKTTSSGTLQRFDNIHDASLLYSLIPLKQLLERVHPELLLVCLLVLVPMLVIALPLLALLLLYALRLYTAIHHLTPITADREV